MTPPPETRLTVPIEGMSGAACVARVETALRSVPGVAGATVNLATERAQVIGRAGPVRVDALRGAVQAADVAHEAADVTLLSGDLRGLVAAFAFSRVRVS